MPIIDLHRENKFGYSNLLHVICMSPEQAVSVHSRQQAFPENMTIKSFNRIQEYNLF